MSNPRVDVHNLRLQGSGNIRRSLSYANKTHLAKRDDLAQLYEELKQRRNELLTDVRQNGALIDQTRSNSRGAIYATRVANPAIKLLQATERQIVTIAKLLTEDAESGEKSAAQLLRDTEKLLRTN